MNDFLEQMRDLVVSGAVPPVLRACHLPCQRLIAFDDFCQNVLVRAVEYHATFRGQSTAELLGWLRAIGRQLMVAMLRRSSQEQTAPLPLDVMDYRQPLPAEQVIAREEEEEKTRWLANALVALDADERELLLRHYYRQESLAAIARDLGLPANTMAQRHVRLLQRLRQFGKT